MTHDFAKVRTAANFIANERRRQLFIDAVNAFEAGIEAKEIWNAEYKDHYSYGISRGATTAIETARDLYCSHTDHEQNIKFYDAEDAAGIVHFNLRPGLYTKAVAKAEKGLADYPKYVEIIKCLAPLDGIVKELKGYIQKGRKPAAPKNPEQVVPATSYQAQKQMTEFLKKTSDQFAPELIANRIKDYMNDFDKVVEKKMTKKELFNLMGAWPAPLVQRAFDLTTTAKDEPLVPLKDAKKIVTDMATRDAETLVQQFLIKNTQKLAGVVARKNKVTKAKVVKTYIRSGQLENEIDFAFDDGSKFTVVSSVVYGWTQRGLMFVKYPTRFTDVYMADGSKMSYPSELKMKKDF